MTRERSVVRQMMRDMGSVLERRFEVIWRMVGGPEPVREHRFDEKRLWRFDFAWPDKRVALELEGGEFAGGRHGRGEGFNEDCEKYNAATLAGWRVFRATGSMLSRDGAAVADMIMEALQ